MPRKTFASREDIRKIVVREYESGATLEVLVKRYKLTRPHVLNFINGKCPHVPRQILEVLGFDSAERYYRRRNGR